MKRILRNILFGVLILLLLSAGFFFIGAPPRAEKIDWGVNFSQKHTQNFGLDWETVYLALLDDLKVKNIKLITNWDLIEPIEGDYDFQDLDWQIKEAEDRQAEILLVIGMKTGRWPECHIPEWARNLSKEEQQKRILKLIEKTVLNYRGSTSIIGWQVENEPFFPFGECPWIDKNFFKKEILLVKSLDFKNRPVVISDSGEGSFWVEAAKFGDTVGTSIYKKVWFNQINIYIHYPFPPTFYWRKAQIIKKLLNKEVICTELQAEPWGPKLLYDSPIEEQEKTMNLEQFQKNVEFAKRTGFSRFYLWGAEWWYWMKVKQNQPAIWHEAKKLF